LLYVTWLRAARAVIPHVILTVGESAVRFGRSAMTDAEGTRGYRLEVFRDEDGSWVAEVPELPGCVVLPATLCGDEPAGLGGDVTAALDGDAA
jgi:hypothetical protein